MFISNCGGDPVNQLNFKKTLKKINEVAPSYECDYK